MFKLARNFVVLFLFSLESIKAQCAMCKAVIEGGDNTMAEGINDGIVFLMVMPYLLVGALIFLLYRYYIKKN